MMNARARILAKLKAAPERTTLPVPDVAAHYAQWSRQESPAARLDRFQRAISAAHADVFHTDLNAWPELLGQILRERQLHTLLVGEGLPHSQRLAAASLPDVSVIPYAQRVEAWRRELFEGVDAALTLARGAIAETGSLILWPTPQEPRLMSLVPPVHVVLLDPQFLHADLHSVVRDENWQGGLPTNALLVSGPSKTADIQQTLAYGAHGPRELIVLVCPGCGRAP